MTDRPLDCSGAVSDILTDWRIVKTQADEAGVVWAWAIQAEQETPWWRLFRRRWLERIAEDNLAARRGLLATIKAAEDRGLDVEAAAAR